MSATDLSAQERLRYARHLTLPQVGETGQHQLRQARVLVVGAGGLGSPVLLYLAAAGVGRIGIVDPDRVAIHNLQRQVLYTEADQGQLKVVAARTRLLALNSQLTIDTYAEALTRHNAERIITPYEIVVDGTDNFPTRYLVNDACVLFDKINVYGSVYRFEGQVAVFNGRLADGSRGPNYRDLFPTPPPPDAVPNCAEDGILGVLPGIIGSLQASEVIKLIVGTGEPLVGQLLLFDAARLSSRTLRVPVRPDAPPITQLIDYEQFCQVPAHEEVPGLDAATWLRLREEGNHFLLVDVREPAEHAQDNLGGQLIPLASLLDHSTILPTDQPLLVYCQSGARSKQAVYWLREQGYDQVFQLEGGLQAVRTLLA